MSCEVQSPMSYLRSFYESLGFNNYKTKTIRLISTTQTGDLTSSYIANNFTSYLEELEKLGNAIQITGGLDPRENPYPSKLRPLDKFDDLNKSKHVLINSINFFAIDTTKIGSVNQNSTVNSAIVTSASSLLNKYAYAGVFGAVLPSFNPNFFRPKVIINGENILDFDLTSLGVNDNQGDLSMGATLPFNIEPNHYFADGVQSINIKGSCVQLIETGGNTYAKRYPVICEVNLTYV